LHIRLVGRNPAGDSRVSTPNRNGNLKSDKSNLVCKAAERPQHSTAKATKRRAICTSICTNKTLARRRAGKQAGKKEAREAKRDKAKRKQTPSRRKSKLARLPKAKKEKSSLASQEN